METYAALARPTRGIVLHAEPAEDLGLAVVHADGDREGVLAHRLAQEVTRRLVETENLGRAVELGLCDREGVIRFVRHDTLR